MTMVSKEQMEAELAEVTSGSYGDALMEPRGIQNDKGGHIYFDVVRLFRFGGNEYRRSAQTITNAWEGPVSILHNPDYVREHSEKSEQMFKETIEVSLLSLL